MGENCRAGRRKQKERKKAKRVDRKGGMKRRWDERIVGEEGRTRVGKERWQEGWIGREGKRKGRVGQEGRKRREKEGQEGRKEREGKKENGKRIGHAGRKRKG